MRKLNNSHISAGCGPAIVKVMSRHYLNKRLLKFNVGFLLSEGPGSAREIPLHIPQRIKIDHELYLESLQGSLLLTRTKEGILAQGTVQIHHQRECDRCLEPMAHIFDVAVAELFASPPDADKSAFSVDGSGSIDLAPLLREEALIEIGYRVVCREGCRGLNAETGLNLNHETDAAAESPPTDSAIDPRLAVLRRLLDEED